MPGNANWNKDFFAKVKYFTFSIQLNTTIVVLVFMGPINYILNIFKDQVLSSFPFLIE